MVHQTFPLGRIDGIRIGAHWSALVTVALFAWILGIDLRGTAGGGFVWTVAVLGALALFASLAAHELAHSIIARRNGIRVDRIVLWLLGGVSELADEPRTAGADLRVALAGPLTSMAVGVLAFAAALVSDAVHHGGPVTGALVWLAVTNVALAVFNLLPGAPLDGGRVLRALIWRHTGDRLRSATVAARCGQYLGTGLIVLGAVEAIVIRQFGGLWLMLLGWFLRTAAHGELTVAGLRHRLGDTTIRDVMSPHPTAVPARWTVGELLGSDAPYTGHRVFPVVDDNGHPIAVVAWSDVAKVPAPARVTTAVSAVARPLSSGAVVHEQDLLADAATRVVLRPELDAIAVVDRIGRLSGVVTATDLVTACERSTLGITPTRPHPPTDRRSHP
jgi:Zn-dependent protease